MTTCCTPNDARVAEESAKLKPRYSVNNGTDAYDVLVELPGVKKDGVEIKLEKNLLSVHAKRSVIAPGEWKPLHRELSELDFLLRLKLNAPVDESKMTAKLDNGVLTLHLPVKEAAKPCRIEVA